MSTDLRYKLTEAAKRHGLSNWILRQAIRENRVEFFRIGNRYELTDEAIEKYLEGMRRPPTA